MSKMLPLPRGYNPLMSILETEVAIKKVKDFFERELGRELKLTRVSAPLFVRPETGLNDNLNGTERPVYFDIRDIGYATAEIVHSLAKWKRMALKKYGVKSGEGIYTDMNAIRRDEELDNLHSIYVDQWDWEKIIEKENRNIDYLKDTVKGIYRVFKSTQDYICSQYPQLEKFLPEDIYFITAQELEDMYPDLSPKEREDIIAEDKKAVFIMQIGHDLKSGIKHDGRAPDYDDWNLNGDIIFWYPVLGRALEVSSMGIRVDETSLTSQLKLSGCEDRRELPFHRDVLEGRLPYSIGGGIGQSRMCMFLLGKAHVGEVQASVWPDEIHEACDAANIMLL